ncbi:MAG: glucosamine-6-phosphate deaminase [Acidimicrobiaceae bacterium]|nr:glucosamine-6-phosphate deaminase [Acidimicrobiaceae bacterium]MDE0515932.1 glucosamine-6-phosphate deaminase [Acidimicrobiaceae bacterium]MDE0654992.1 glucosamine-6-phosphate deaminase [Acidimicrobiaceae bacterium]
MRVVISESATAAARVVADLVERFITSAPRPALGLATGETMEAVFVELVRRHREQGLSFACVQAYLLDEYLTLDHDDQSAYRNVVHRLLAGRVDMGPGAIHGPNPQALDVTAECARYERQVREASIGLQLLGIGANGHIAFNEPGSPLDSVTWVVELSEQTRADNARFFPAGRSVPSRAITQGIATIGAAAQLVLVACGEHKAAAVARAVEGPVTAEVPASALQLHPRVTVVLDRWASSGLARSAS